MPVTTNFYI